MIPKHRATSAIFGLIALTIAIGYFFTLPERAPLWVSDTAKAFVVNSLNEFCNELGANACLDRTVQVKNRALTSNRFLSQSAPQVEVVKNILEKKGWVGSGKIEFGAEIFCKAPYFASYEITDGWVRSVIFGVGGDECKAIKT